MTDEQRECVEMVQELQIEMTEFLHALCPDAKKFYRATTAKKFYRQKRAELDALVKSGEIKSYHLGMSLVEWPYRVIWSQKYKGRVTPPMTLILTWSEGTIREITNECP